MGLTKTSRAAALSALATLAGCAHGPELAADQPSASVRFLSKNSLGRAVFSYDDESCHVSKTSGWLGTTGGYASMGESSTLGMLDTPPRSNQVFERRVPADHPFVFSWLREIGQVNLNGLPVGSVIAGCSATFTATLQPGGQYEAVYDNTEGRCEMTLARLSRSADGGVSRTPEPTLQQLGRLCGANYYFKK